MRQQLSVMDTCAFSRRRKLPRFAALALAGVCSAATDAHAQAPGRSCTIHVVRTSPAAGPIGTRERGAAIVRGTVTDVSGKPLDATITIQSLGLGANADANGKGSFIVPPSRLPADSLVIAVRRIGYRALQGSVRIASGDTITFTASLCSSEPVVVRHEFGSPEHACLGPDEVSQADVKRFRQLVRSSDSAEMAFRRAVHIPVVPDPMVHLVTDGRVCRPIVRAWAAADSALGASPPYRSELYVIRIGPVLVATVPPKGRAIGRRQYVVYDSRFAVLAPFLW